MRCCAFLLWLGAARALRAFPARQHAVHTACSRSGLIVCGQRLKIVSVGKTKERWLDEAISEYTKRLRPTLALEFVWVKDDGSLLDAWRKTVASGETVLVQGGAGGVGGVCGRRMCGGAAQRRRQRRRRTSAL